MIQYEYEEIIKCIQFGAPAQGEQLVKSFNNTVQLANQKLIEIEAEKKKKAEIQANAATLTSTVKDAEVVKDVKTEK